MTRRQVNGTFEDIEWKDGLMHGKRRVFNSKGTVQFEEIYENGIKVQ